MASAAPGDIAIRAATLDDAGAIERVRVAGWRAAYPGLVPQTYLDAMRLDVRGIDKRRQQMNRNPPDVRSLVSLAAGGGNAVVGFVVYGPDREGDHRSTVAGPRAGEVYALYVDPGAWSHGHGRALLDRATYDLVGDGYTRAGLWVLEGNARARAFYERFGMSATGERQMYEVSGVRVPEVRYEISIPPEGSDRGGG